MLRIFGKYTPEISNNLSTKNTVKEMCFFSKNTSAPTKYKFFNFSNVSIGYEILESSASKNFYHISNDKNTACFIVGNIFSYENSNLEILSGKNIANFVLNHYKINKFTFLKHLRGEFNIVIIDNGKLFLINDKLGLSPMYIYKTHNDVYFCSEAEPIIWLNKKNNLDHTSIAEFLIYGFIPDGKTFIKGLYNQKPSTIIRINPKKFSSKVYSSPVYYRELNDIPTKKRAKHIKNMFSEAVKIRLPANEKGEVVQELTGGWDTRFLLATLLSLDEKPVTVTENISKNDLLIAKHIAKKNKVKHFTINNKNTSFDRIFDQKLRLHKRSFFAGSKNMSFSPNNTKNKIFKNILQSKRFTGLFGSEIFGFMSETFFHVFEIDFSTQSKQQFTGAFLDKIKNAKQLSYQDTGVSNNIFHQFFTQFTRSYWNIYINMQRDRIFDYFSLHPFADSKIVETISSLKYKNNMNYKIYTVMFKLFYEDFLKEPYTFEYHRKQNGCVDTWDIGFEREKQLFQKRALKDKDFSFFLKNQHIFKTNHYDHECLKKLYCIFNWLKTYKSKLNNLSNLFPL